ncbi:MAG: glycosyltransferase family 4 protein [Candidatus Kerfeldbacteria bacterium]|nr:glycosyltransferase family 4 protein [Candidatus Kerfeldbacteria bacterium]
MRILSCVVSPGHGGGAENAALELARAVHARGHAVTLARMAVADGQHVNGITIRDYRVKDAPLLPKPYSNVFSRSRIVDAIDPAAYDLVHLHNTHPAMALAQLARRCLRVGLPYVVTTHGLVETLNSRHIFRTNPLLGYVIGLTVDRPLKFVVRNAKKIAVLSMSEAPLLAGLGVDPKNITPIYNGADPRFLLPYTASVDVRSRYHIPPGRHVALFVGNLKKNKGVEVLLQAVAKVDDVTAVVVGAATQPGYEQSLRRQAADLGIDERVVFAGRVSDEELMAWHHAATVFVLPTLGDTFPLVVLDAMAAGKPVVASAIGGIPEQIGDEAGLTVPPGDPTALAAAIRTVVRDPALATRYGEAGRRRVEQRFTWARVAENVESVYTALL